MSDETTVGRITFGSTDKTHELYAVTLHTVINGDTFIIDGVPLAEYIKRIVDERIQAIMAEQVDYGKAAYAIANKIQRQSQDVENKLPPAR